MSYFFNFSLSFDSEKLKKCNKILFDQIKLYFAGQIISDISCYLFSIVISIYWEFHFLSFFHFLGRSFFLTAKGPPLQKYIFHLQFLLKMSESSEECGRVCNYVIRVGMSSKATTREAGIGQDLSRQKVSTPGCRKAADL